MSLGRRYIERRTSRTTVLGVDGLDRRRSGLDGVSCDETHEVEVVGRTRVSTGDFEHE